MCIIVWQLPEDWLSLDPEPRVTFVLNALTQVHPHTNTTDETCLLCSQTQKETHLEGIECPSPSQGWDFQAIA